MIESQRQLEARLVPTLRADWERREYDLTWHLSIDGGASEAGPAGTAALHAPDGTAIDVEYLDPTRLLGLRVPFGRVVDDATHETSVELFSTGGFDAVGRELVSLLLGDDVVSALEAPAQLAQQFSVSSNSHWSTVGRLALAATCTRRQAVPLDGFWALESAGLVADLGAAPSLRSWAGELLDAAKPLLEVLDPSWADWSGVTKARDHFQDSVLACGDLGQGGALGPLAERLAAEPRQAVDDLIRSVQPERMEVSLGSEMDDVERGRELELPSFRGGWLGGDDEDSEETTTELTGEPVRVLTDLSVRGLLAEDPVAAIDGTDLVLSLEVVNAVASSSLVNVIALRVTDVSGSLLAAVASMATESPARLRARVCLGRRARAHEITVVVGRALPFSPITENQHVQNQAVELTARAVDARRTGSTGTDDAVRAAQGARSDLSTTDVATAIATADAQEPFLAERMRTVAPDLDQNRFDATSPRHLSGARSLAWTRGELAAAADHESDRLAAGGAAEELDPWEICRLAFAAWSDEAVDTGQVLDRAGLDRFYG